MAIKIIKSGKKRVAVFRATCSVCECVIEFNKEDAFFGEDRDGKFIKIKCPDCGQEFYSWQVNPYRYDEVKNTK